MLLSNCCGLRPRAARFRAGGLGGGAKSLSLAFVRLLRCFDSRLRLASPSEREQTLRRSRRGLSSRRSTSLTRRGGLPRCSSPISPTLALTPRRGGRTSTLRPDRTCAADFHSLSTSWRGVGLGFAPSNDNERISTPRPWGIAAKFVPKSAKGFRSPTGAALIHPLSAHRIICGLPSGSGETRRLAKHPSGRLRRCPSGSAYSKTERGSFPTKQACRKSAPLPEHRFATRYRSGDMRSVFRLRRASRPNVDIAPAGRGGQSAAPCGHFARPLATASRLGLRPRATRRLRRGRISLVRSTFGLRGFPPLRFGASRWWCRCQSAALCPLDCASHFSTPDCGRSSGFVSRSRNEAGFARISPRRRVD